ncbi:relA [Symbiodinium microadriaticum]|nr:relA [Symbiodinium microadriaticum]
MPKASSRAIGQRRTVDTMTCKLEVHVFSGSMKQKERKGLASHHLYKAFELGPDEIFASLGGRAADSIAPSQLRRAVFPLERLHLFGEAFSADYMDREFRELCSSCDRSQDGRLTFVDVQTAQHQVSKRLEDFRRALEQRNANWWVHGVQTVGSSLQSLGTASWDWAKYAAELDPQQKVSMLHKALDMTKQAHAGQVRKSGDPYWTHPLAVADILARALLPPDSTPPEPRWQLDGPGALEQDAQKLWPRVADGPDDIFAMYTAALLHDTVEDTNVTLDQIEDAFGPVVASLVDGVTKASQASCTRSRASRSAQDLRKVLTRAAQDVRVLVIKFADRLHNMRTLAEETRAVYVPLAERLGVHIWKTEFEELCCRYLNGCAYEEVLERNRRSQVARQRHRRYIQQYIRTMMVEMTSDSILEICVREEPPHTQLRRWADRPETDTPQPIPRVRIVTKDRDACWACLGRIHSILPPMPGRLRDYISSPKENLYMCLHTTVLMDGTAVEVYILSLQMEWVAEFGVGAFWRHNEDLQESEAGRGFLAALHSTWILQANQSLTHSLHSLEVSMEPSSLPTSQSTSSRQSVESAESQPKWNFQDSDGTSPLQMQSVSTNSEPRSSLLDRSPQRFDLDRGSFDEGTREALVDEPGAAEQEDGLYAVQPLLQHISKVASDFAGGTGNKERDDGEDGGELLAELHRAYSEALREKVAVFTPTGRVLYLPRDATPLDFAVWNLGAKKGLRAEAAFIDSSEATLNTRLREGQTVLVHLQDDEKLPPLEWSGVHLRYLRTTRARAALVDMRTQMLSEQQAVEEGREAIRKELALHSLDLSLRQQLGDEVLAAVGRGALPVELISGQLLAARLHMPLGDASYEYTGNAGVVSSPGEAYKQCFMLVAEDKPGLMVEVVAVVRDCGLDFQRFSAEPCGDGLCVMVAAVQTDCALRFGSLMHNLRYRAEPVLLQRLPTELSGEALQEWMLKVPFEPLADLSVWSWKREALSLVMPSEIRANQPA